MKKSIAVLTAVLLVLCSFCFSSAEEQKATGIRSANGISWAGADMVLPDDIPDLSGMFPGKEVQLGKLGGNERITLFSGPENDYMTIRKINPRERNTTTAYFRENGRVFVHYVHRSADVYAYVFEESIMAGSLKEIPEAEKLRPVSMTTKKEAIPKTGPGEQFKKWPESEIPEDSRIKCWFREGNYCYVEYEFPTGPARVWVDTSVIGLSTILEVDGFTFEIAAGADYSLGDNETDQCCMSVKPFAAKGDDLTEIGISRLKTTAEITVDLIRNQMPSLIEQTEKSFSTSSTKVNSIDHTDPVSGTLGGEPCVTVDLQVNLTVSGITLNSYMRYIYMSKKGFDILVATSIDKETLETAATVLNTGLKWQ